METLAYIVYAFVFDMLTLVPLLKLSFTNSKYFISNHAGAVLGGLKAK